MRQALTDVTIRQLPHPAKGSVKYWDEVVRGFGVRVTKGSKSFFVMYGTDRRLQTLGKYPSMSLKIARQEAIRVKSTDTPQQRLHSLSAARDAFLKEVERTKRPKTVSMYRLYLEQIDKPRITDVTKDDIDISYPQMVASWKRFFNWCIREELVTRNPFALLPTRSKSRDRVLSHDELKLLWQYDYPPFSDILKLLILTGLRRTETTHIVRNDADFTLPAEHSKNGRALTIPLTPLVARYAQPYSFGGWSKAKQRLDKQIEIPHWTIHDIRRTFATEHAKIGTPIHVVEALLNHASGSISGVAAIYIRHNFLDEARTAQLAYEEHLKGILSVS